MEMTTDMLAPAEYLAGSAPAAPAELNPLALLTIKPEEYVAQVFAPFRAKLATLKAEADAIHFVGPLAIDITTTAGMAVAVKMRAAFRDDVRLSVEKTKVARKAPILQIGRLLDSTYNEIVAEVTPYEGKFDAAIKAEEKRKADIKAAKERAEAERIGTIQAAIEAIRALPARAAGKSAEELRALLERVAARVITKEEFDQFDGEAQTALDAAGEELVAMYEAAVAAERAAAAAEAEERDQLAKIETDRIAAEHAAEAKRLRDLAAAQEAELQKMRDAEAARVRAEQAERDRVAAETKRQMEEQQAAIAAERRALDEQKAAAARAEQARIEAEQLRAKVAVDEAEALAMNAQFDVDREAERVRLQQLADQAAVDARDRAADEHAAGLPAGALGVDAIADMQITDELTDDEIVRLVADTFDLTILAAVERLAAIDFDAARTLAEAV